MFFCTSTIEKEVREKVLEYFSFMLLNQLCNLKAEDKNVNQMILKNISDWKEKISAGFNIYETKVQRK